MPVSSTINAVSYTPNGIQMDFAFPYYVAQLSDIFVMDGVGKIYNLTTDYTIADVPNAFGAFPSGLTVHFLSAPIGGTKFILIQRRTQIIQNVLFIDNDPFTADSLNFALDRLCLAIQDRNPGLFDDGQFKGFAYSQPVTETGITYIAGDWFKNINPTTQSGGDPFGWVCVFPGQPGIWCPFGITLPHV